MLAICSQEIISGGQRESAAPVPDSGLPTGPSGRVKVDRYLRVLDHPEIYVAGGSDIG